MKQKLYRIFSFAAAVILVTSFSACGQTESGSELSDSSASGQVSDSSQSSESSSVSESESSQSAEPASSSKAPSSTASSSAAVAGDSYFSDTLFVGDSLTNGLYLYGDINTADYCFETSATAASITTVTPLLSKLSEKKYGKIYILLGVNEMGLPASQYINNYKKLLQTIRSYQPNAAIYIQTILPTNPSMTWSASIFSVKNVTEKNSRLKQLAAEESAHLVDTYSAYANDKGEMPAEYCRDGVHPREKYYKYWCEYLRSHKS